MPSRSQRHLRERDGYDSSSPVGAGGSTAIPTATLTDAGGTNAEPSDITLAGTFTPATRLRVKIVSVTVNAYFEYVPTTQQTAAQAATGWAAVIAAHAKLASTAVGAVVQTLSEGGEVAHTLSELQVLVN